MATMGEVQVLLAAALAQLSDARGLAEGLQRRVRVLEGELLEEKATVGQLLVDMADAKEAADERLKGKVSQWKARQGRCTCSTAGQREADLHGQLKAACALVTREGRNAALARDLAKECEARCVKAVEVAEAESARAVADERRALDELKRLRTQIAADQASLFKVLVSVGSRLP